MTCYNKERFIFFSFLIIVLTASKKKTKEHARTKYSLGVTLLNYKKEDIIS